MFDHCKKVIRLKADCQKWDQTAELILLKQENAFYEYINDNYLNEMDACAKILGIDCTTTKKVFSILLVLSSNDTNTYFKLFALMQRQFPYPNLGKHFLNLFD